MKFLSKYSFFLASKKYGILSVTFSLIATILGASSVIGLIEKSADTGLPALWWLFSGSIGLLVLNAIISKIDLENYYSISEFFGNIYGGNYRRLSALLIVLAWTGIIAAQYAAMGKTLQIIFNVDYSTGAVISALIILFYTSLKGQSGVVFTDKIQTFIILAGILILFFNIDFDLMKKNSGISEYSDVFAFPVNSKFDWLALLNMLFAVSITYIIGPDIYSRLLTAKNKNVSKKSVLISSLMIFIIAIALVLIGINLRFINNSGSDFLFGFFLNQNMLIKILFVIVVFSIIASSADTCIMTSSTLITNDILRFKDQSKCVLFARISMIAVSSVSAAISIASPFIIENILWAYKIFSLSFFTPFICVIILKLKLEETKLLILNFFIIVLFASLNFYNQSLAFLVSSLIYFFVYAIWSKFSK